MRHTLQIEYVTRTGIDRPKIYHFVTSVGKIDNVSANPGDPFQVSTKKSRFNMSITDEELRKKLITIISRFMTENYSGFTNRLCIKVQKINDVESMEILNR